MILSEIKIALRQVLIHKSRAIYIFLLSFFLGFLTIFLSIMSISIKINGTDIAYMNYESKDSYYAKFVCAKLDNYSSFYLKNNYDEIINELNNYNNYIYYYKIYVNYGEKYFGTMSDVDLLENNKYISFDDRLDKLDNDKYVYLEKNYADDLNLKSGDIFEYIFKLNSGSSITFNFKVAGVFNYLIEDKDNSNIILDKSVLLKSKDYSNGQVKIVFNKNSAIKDIISVNEKIIDYFNLSNDGNVNVYSTYKYYGDVITYTNIFFYISLLVIIILIISAVAILVNSINVLLDINKEFLGLMKVLGAKNKKIRNIIVYEIGFIVGLGLLLSLVMFDVLTYINKMVFIGLIYSIFYYIDANILNSCSMSCYGYLPIVVLIIIMVIIILLSVRSIKKVLYGNAISMLRRVD